MSSTDYHSLISRLYNPTIPQFKQCRQSNTSVWTYKHARRICLSRSIHQFLLSGFLNNPIRLLQRINSPVNRNRITNLYSRRKRRISLHCLEVFPPCLKIQIKWIRICCLSTNKPRNPINKP
ncbi:hypothetical protein Lal_00045404 [Lupinus albus]|nr:hypothetical protein Lal_00045404 [Lupinus albus]